MYRTGSPNDRAGGHYNRAFAVASGVGDGKVVGVQLHHLHRVNKVPTDGDGDAAPVGAHEHENAGNIVQNLW
jgi:hypothetical protein